MNENFDYGYKDNSKIRKPLIIIVVIAIILLVGAIIYFKFMKKNDNENTNTNQSQQSISTNDNNTGSTNITTENDKDGAFLMAIEDVFKITGKGTVVTGRIERGTIKLNDTVQIIGLHDEIKTTTIIGIEMRRENFDTATAGDRVGLLLNGIEKDEVERGQVLAKPNSISNATKFAADVYILTKKEGGGSTPIVSNYSSEFYFRTEGITGTIILQSGVEMISPGDSAKITAGLISPVAMEIGTEFSIREAGRTIAIGTVTQVY